jgi:hypothetical protein
MEGDGQGEDDEHGHGGWSDKSQFEVQSPEWMWANRRAIPRSRPCPSTDSPAAESSFATPVDAEQRTSARKASRGAHCECKSRLTVGDSGRAMQYRFVYRRARANVVGMTTDPLSFL